MPNLHSLLQKMMSACCTSHNTSYKVSTASLPLLTSGAALSCVYEFGLWC